MKKLKSKLFEWLFRDELKQIIGTKESVMNTLQEVLNVSGSVKRTLRDVIIYEKRSKETLSRLEDISGSTEVCVDVHKRSNSWAVICLQGEKSNFIKFVDLGEKDIREISHFLRNFERNKIDAHPFEIAAIREELRRETIKIPEVSENIRPKRRK